MRLSIVIPSPVFFFFFFERSRELEIPPSLGNVFFFKTKKKLEKFVSTFPPTTKSFEGIFVPPFFLSLKRHCCPGREGKGGEMFCPSAATAAYPR